MSSTRSVAWRMVVTAAGVAVLVLGCAGAGAPSPVASEAPASPPAAESPAGASIEVTLATDATLGDFLVGEGGKTLYLFTRDSGGASSCSGDCAAAWPPFVVPEGTTVAGGEGVTGSFATITRDDGALQVTYAGAPLYYFAADAAAGDVKGQGVNDVWFVVSPSGAPVSGTGGSAAASATPIDDEYSRGGGGATAAPATTSQAAIADFEFSPPTLTVAAGTTVTWTNGGAVPHTVTADDGSFESGRLTSRDRFSRAFETAGTFAYHCAIHPQMTGTVVVTP
jgi:predicted lipoprotein with Yx(FWY)xxD motif/plastocyanin